MLRDLHVRNLAVLAEAAVEFGPGLNVLSGETGAGKSLVVDSLELLAGVRASTELIRTGADTLTVSGVFAPAGEGWRELLREAGVEVDGGELVVRREISREGRNRVFVNDQPVTLRLLTDLAPWLLTIHGQREELGLADADLQRRWLDRSGGAEAGALLAACAEAWQAYRRVADRLEPLTGDERERRERIDLLRFQAREIDAANLREGEEDELHAERDVLRHAETILEALGGAAALLSEDEGSADERVRRAQERLEEIAAWDPLVREWVALLDAVQAQLQEVAVGVARRLGEIEVDPGRLDAVETRLAALERLLRRYGGSSAEILRRRGEIGAELDELEVDESGRARLEAQVAAALDSYRRAAEALSQARARWGGELSARIGRELEDLALARARLEVRVEPRRRGDSPLVVAGQGVEFGPQGWDAVVFLFSPNAGEELRPLARVASGGELARVYLALQLAVRGEGVASGSAMVFDEVDAGVGGREAAAVGQKLRRLASGGQILAVTHLPQVASFAHRHFRIHKRVEGGRTFTAVEPLETESRVDEVARMLAGERITDLSRSHARELLATGAGE